MSVGPLDIILHGLRDPTDGGFTLLMGIEATREIGYMGHPIPFDFLSTDDVRHAYSLYTPCERRAIAPAGGKPILALSFVLFDLLRAFMFFSSPEGQGLVEYALLILLVGIAVIVMLALFGSGVGNMFSNVMANI